MDTSPATQPLSPEKSLASEKPRTLSVSDSDHDPEVTWRSWIPLFAAVLNYLGSTFFLTGSAFFIAPLTSSVGDAAVGLWVTQGWVPTHAILAPPISRIGDLVGRKVIWLIALVCGALGSALVAGSQNIGTAIVGSVIFGVGFANSGNLAAAPSECLPRRHRGTTAIAIQMGGYAGTAITLLGGSTIVQNYATSSFPGWRIMFTFTSLIHVVVFFIVLIGYKQPVVLNPESRTITSRIVDFDKIGTFLFAAALLPFLVALLWSPTTYAFDSAGFIAPCTIGLVFLLILIAHQRFIKKDGIFAHAILKHRNASLALIAVFVEGLVYLTFNTLYGLQSGALYDARLFYVGLRFAVFIFGAMLGSVIWMYIAYRYRRVNEQLIIGFALFLIAVIGLCTATPGSGKVVNAYAAIAGFGFASPIACLFTVIQLAVDARYIAQVSGLVVSVRGVGGAVGPAIANAVFTDKLTVKLPEYIAQAGLAAGLPPASLAPFVGGLATGNVTLAASAPGASPEILAAGGQAALEAYADSFRYIWIVSVPFVVVGLIAVSCMSSVREALNAVVDRPLEPTRHVDGKEQEASEKA